MRHARPLFRFGVRRLDGALDSLAIGWHATWSSDRIVRMEQQKERVSIRDLNATQSHHFLFKIGDRVRVKDSNRVGTVEDAFWEHQSHGAFTVTYCLVTKGGEKLQVEMSELEGWEE